MESLGQLLPDKYELNARLKPALLLLLPAIIVVLAWVPSLQSLGGAVLTLAVTCGVTYLLSQIARRRGRDLEQRSGDRVGRKQSAKLLSHGDSQIRAGVKQRIIELVRKHGPGFPTEAEEQANSAHAEERRLDAIEWLLEVTRADAEASLLLAENIAYGFWRNLRALKAVGLMIALAAAAVDGWLLYSTDGNDPRFAWGIVAGVFSLLAILAWLFLVTREQVEDASLTYAKRLFAQADNPALKERLEGTTSKRTKPKAKAR
jgi:hypothetical protein